MKLATLLGWAHMIWLGFWNKTPYARKLTFEHKSVTKMHRTYLLNEHIFNDKKRKGFQWYFILEFKVKHFVLRSGNTKKCLMGNKIVNNGGKLHAWTREVTPPFKCILNIFNSQGDFGVWLLTLAFILSFIACLSNVTLLLLHMAWKRLGNLNS